MPSAGLSTRTDLPTPAPPTPAPARSTPRCPRFHFCGGFSNGRRTWGTGPSGQDHSGTYGAGAYDTGADGNSTTAAAADGAPDGEPDGEQSSTASSAAPTARTVRARTARARTAWAGTAWARAARAGTVRAIPVRARTVRARPVRARTARARTARATTARATTLWRPMRRRRRDRGAGGSGGRAMAPAWPPPASGMRTEARMWTSCSRTAGAPLAGPGNSRESAVVGPEPYCRCSTLEPAVCCSHLCVPLASMGRGISGLTTRTSDSAPASGAEVPTLRSGEVRYGRARPSDDRVPGRTGHPGRYRDNRQQAPGGASRPSRS